ncbi:hypothetical protein MSP7336_01126 [Mycobacterium shimoidei]|uniref:Uncharacterized protein n=1 Tax=Mycobacterium shimoidei TaxID=29313 RepID=A0A375YVM6_MYCSH|nr:hypothetical protein MSP7336_01126 [Mycobacterium shimoidei]
MTSPPPQNPWGAGPGAPGPGQPGFGPPPQGQPYGPPQGQQQPWYPPAGPPKKGGSLKWVIIGVVALVAVIAMAVAVTVVVLRSNSDGGSHDPATPTSGLALGIASGADKGPAALITSDSTCAAWTPIGTNLSAGQSNGWENRDPSVPATSWTPEQHSQYQAAAQAMRTAADQSVALAKTTPHRVMRELYEQFIAYARAYADRIPNYTANDDHLARVANSASSTIGAICAAVADHSAEARAPFIEPAAPPSKVTPPGDPASPTQFLTKDNPTCGPWKMALDQLDADTADWRATDPNVPAAEWGPEQKKVNDDAAQVMSKFAQKIETLGQQSGNSTWQDFATLAAQYRRAFVQSIPSYTPADNQLANVSAFAGHIINSACAAVER